jgi:transcription elongation factor Elf1
MGKQYFKCPFCHETEVEIIKWGKDLWQAICGSCGSRGPIDNKRIGAKLLWHNVSNIYFNVMAESLQIEIKQNTG